MPGSKTTVDEESQSLTPRRRAAQWPEQKPSPARRCRALCCCASSSTPVARLRCAACAVALAAFMFLIFVYSAVMLSRFNPVFSPVVCRAVDQQFAMPTRLTFPVQTNGSATMSCTSSNPYRVLVDNTEPGVVRANGQDIGLVSVESFAIPAKGEAVMNAHLSLSIPLDVGLSLLGKPATLTLELHTQATAEVGIVVAVLPMVQKQVSYCGFGLQVNMDPLYFAHGNPACARSLETLEIPSMNDTRVVNFALGPSPEELKPTQMVVNAGCGTMLALSGLCGLLLLLWATRVLLRQPKAGDGDDRSDENSEEGGHREVPTFELPRKEPSSTIAPNLDGPVAPCDRV